MTSVQLKSNINKIIEGIQNEQLLQSIYDFLKNSQHTKSKLWDNLTEEQKKEVLLAYEESEDESNLLDSDEVMKKYR